MLHLLTINVPIAGIISAANRNAGRPGSRAALRDTAGAPLKHAATCTCVRCRQVKACGDPGCFTAGKQRF